MFRGINAVSLDTKGRFSLPARYRSELGLTVTSQLVITIDAADRCLLIYPPDVWAEIEQKLEKLSSFDPIMRRIQRLLIGYATEVELDANGRILLPPLLRESANLKRQAVLIGQGKKFELWDKETWDQARDAWQKQGLTMPDLPQELQGLSL